MQKQFDMDRQPIYYLKVEEAGGDAHRDNAEAVWIDSIQTDEDPCYRRCTASINVNNCVVHHDASLTTIALYCTVRCHH